MKCFNKMERIPFLSSGILLRGSFLVIIMFVIIVISICVCK